MTKFILCSEIVNQRAMINMLAYFLVATNRQKVSNKNSVKNNDDDIMS